MRFGIFFFFLNFYSKRTQEQTVCFGGKKNFKPKRARERSSGDRSTLLSIIQVGWSQSLPVEKDRCCFYTSETHVFQILGLPKTGPAAVSFLDRFVFLSWIMLIQDRETIEKKTKTKLSKNITHQRCFFESAWNSPHHTLASFFLTRPSVAVLFGFIWIIS